MAQSAKSAAVAAAASSPGKSHGAARASGGGSIWRGARIDGGGAGGVEQADSRAAEVAISQRRGLGLESMDVTLHGLRKSALGAGRCALGCAGALAVGGGAFGFGIQGFAQGLRVGLALRFKGCGMGGGLGLQLRVVGRFLIIEPVGLPPHSE